MVVPGLAASNSLMICSVFWLRVVAPHHVKRMLPLGSGSAANAPTGMSVAPSSPASSAAVSGLPTRFPSRSFVIVSPPLGVDRDQVSPHAGFLAVFPHLRLARGMRKCVRIAPARRALVTREPYLYTSYGQLAFAKANYSADL